MKMYIKILSITLLLQQISSTCGDGCLVCSPSGECKICDLQSFYVNKSGTCKKITIDQCRKVDLNGNCLECIEEYYLDTFTKKCIELNLQTKLSNCIQYKNPQECQLCAKSFYLKEGKCEKVLIEVPGCELQNSTHCLVCDQGSILHPTGERCIANPSQSNCLSFGYLQCDQCDSGYFYNSNIFVSNLERNESHEIVEQFLLDASEGKQNYRGLSPCQKIEIPNCVEFETFTKCKKCEAFYLLEDDQCKRFPLPEIPNCEIYENYNICSQCQQGFILSSPLECNKVKEIENCLKYNPQSSINICIECQDKFYVNNNGCQDRLLDIANCSVKTTDSDSCDECISGYQITNDKLKCLPVISNCGVYTQSQNTDSQLTCSSCDNGFYLSNNTCTSGSIANCSVYASQTVCSVCVEGFFWNGQECKAHTLVTNCIKHSQSTADLCDQCDQKYFLLKQTQGCKKIETLIANCNVYTNETTCNSCDDSYYLTNNKCELIPVSENCLQKNTNNTLCIKCKNNYILINGVCKLPFDFETRYCNEMIQNTSNTYQCHHCQLNTFPFTYTTNTSMCVKEEEMTNRLGAAGSLIENCSVYSITNLGVRRCKRCIADYYVEQDGLSCTQTCSGSLMVKSIVSNEGTYDLSECTTTSINGCAKIARQIDSNDYTNSVDVCIECKSGYYRKIPTTTKYTFYTDMKKQLGLSHYTVECVLMPNSVTYTTTQNTSVPLNCDAYEANGAQLRCKRCKFGYTGIVDQNDVLNLICDYKVKDCDVDVIYGNHPFQTNTDQIHTNFQDISCHRCLTQGRIPVVFSTQTHQYTQFGIQYGNGKMKDTGVNTGQRVQCMDMVPESFEMDKERFFANFIDNCAIANVFVDLEKDFRYYSYNSNIKCIQCEPGYRPVFHNTANVITQCQKIENCDRPHIDELQWFNSCRKCENGFSWMWDNNAIRYDLCVESKDPKCLVSYPLELNYQTVDSNHPSRHCLFCDIGHFINEDGVCQQINTPLCKDNMFIYQQNNYNTELSYIRDYFGDFSGCLECQNGYYGVQWLSTTTVCANNTHRVGDYHRPYSQYIENCKHFKWDYTNSNKSCYQCNSNYLPNQNMSKCVPQEVFPNCTVVDNDLERCHTCDSNYVLINGYCEKPLIRYCMTYHNNMSYQKCQQCDDTFKLINNQCIKGTIQYCDVYDNDQKCTQCQLGYYLKQTVNSQYCFKLPTDWNCSSLSIVDNLGQLQCNSCNAGYIQSSVVTDLIQSSCHSINLIENCKTYSNTNVINLSSYQCLVCEEGYYMKDMKCVRRLQNTSNCLTYSSSHDFCVSCQTGYYLTNEKQCEQYPKGIYGCDNYSTLTKCEQCLANMYLINNKCIEIPTVNRISFCEIYQDSVTCKKCQFNYFLVDNKCVRSEARNCQTQESINECKTCPTNYGYFNNTSNNTIDCIYISTQNCHIAETTYPFKCQVCQRLYYQEEGRCFPNDQFIPNCERYKSRDTCMKCDKGYILSSDYKRCMSGEEFGLQPFESCTNNYESKNPICNACQFGYQLYKGNCFQCKKHTLSNGCLYCQGVENETCVICKSGYFMSRTGECAENGSQPKETIPEPTPEPTPEEDATNDTETTENTTETTTTVDTSDSQTTDTNETTTATANPSSLNLNVTTVDNDVNTLFN